MNYKSKAKDSFRTKFNIYLFKHVIMPATPWNIDAFLDYSIEPEVVKLHTTQYYQFTAEEKVNGMAIREVEQRIIAYKKHMTSEMREWEARYISEIFPTKFPKDQFDKIARSSKCGYCQITTDEIDHLINNGRIFKKRLRGYNMELDRKDSNYEYTPVNCVPCCYWCNNAKTDEFSAEEFKSIGDSIRGIWQSRLKGV